MHVTFVSGYLTPETKSGIEAANGCEAQRADALRDDLVKG
jgi:hypothetical protein